MSILAFGLKVRFVYYIIYKKNKTRAQEEASHGIKTV